jgi:hypothetical protein
VVLDAVSAHLQSFFGLPADVRVTIGQSNLQRFQCPVGHAAATVLANLIANLVCRFRSNTLVGVVQRVNECCHDLGAALATVTIAQPVDGSRPVFGVTRRLGLEDQLGNGTCVIGTAAIFAACSRSASI